jgi:hypothetical protein
VGTDTEVLKVEYAHVIRDLSELKRRLDNMEEIVTNLRIGIAKIVMAGAVVTVVATSVLNAAISHFVK